jgi:uncharacterized damage-inducible protein DinB
VNLIGHLRRQIDYDAWANRETLRSLEAAKGDAAGPLRVFAHVLGAEQLWLGRVGGFPAKAPVWPELTLADCERQLADLARRWTALFSGLDGAWLAEPVRYVNSKGEPWTSTVVDIVQHVVLHSAYHRGQIAAALRSVGDTPAYTDFIHCVRSGALPAD